MAEFFTPLQTIWAREYALPGPVAGADYGDFPVSQQPPGVPRFINLERSVPPGAKITTLHGYWIDLAGTDLGEGQWTAGIGGSFPPAGPNLFGAVWQKTGPGPSSLPNGDLNPIDQRGRVAVVAGDASDDIPPGAVRFRGEVNWVNYGCPIGQFHDDGGGEIPPNIPSTLERVRSQVAAAGGGQTNVALVGSVVPINITSAGGAFVRSDGVVTIAPSDTGVGPDKIPADPNLNNGGIFGQHPSVFLRETQAVRGYKLPQGNPPFTYITITSDSPNNPIAVQIVSRAPTHSRWILFIDSEQHDVIVAHPVGSNLRRPRDIWNAVFGGALQTRQGVGAPLPIFTEAAAFGARQFFQLGEVRHLKYLQAAIFVEPFDTNEGPILVPFPQDIP